MRWSADVVLTGQAASEAPKARMDQDLRSDAGTHTSRVDPRRFDPRLAQQYEEAAAQARAMGRAEGFTIGYRDGRMKAEADARVEAEQTARLILAREAEREEELASVLHLLRQAVDAYERMAASAYVEAGVGFGPAAYSLATSLVGHELSVTPDHLMDSIRRIASVAPRGSSVILHVCPSDAPLIVERAELIESILGRDTEMVTDPSLMPGDIVADSGASRIDARLSTAMARVAEVLGATPAVSGPSDPGTNVPAQRQAPIEGSTR